jgi:DNA-binding beta-propeller fold protein YncE
VLDQGIALAVWLYSSASRALPASAPSSAVIATANGGDLFVIASLDQTIYLIDAPRLEAADVDRLGTPSG